MEVAHNRGWQSFEMIVGLPFVVSIALQLIVPISLPDQFIKPVTIIIGAALIIVGVAFVVLARKTLAQFGQPTEPGHPTSRIVTTGVFSFSRNPLYLGGICALSGIALVARLTWFFILFLPILIACHYILIAPEERYLTARFGDEYTRYTARVRRWIGRHRISDEHRDRPST